MAATRLAQSVARVAVLGLLLALTADVHSHEMCSDEHFKQNGVFTEEDFEHCTSIIDQDGVGRPVLLYWEADVSSNSISIAAQFPTASGWVGLGFGVTGSMYGADIAVVTTNDKNEWVAHDMFSTENAQPSMDEHQDVELIAVEVSGDNTFIKLQRPLKTCHPAEDRDIVDLLTPVVVAYGSSYSFVYHTWRHAKEINFIADHPHVHSSVENEMYEDVLMPSDFVVPSDGVTQYCYTAHHLPADKKYHLIRAEPAFRSSHPETLHHIVIYSCQDEHSLEDLEAKPKCNDDAHRMRDGCETFYTLWAVGGTVLELPEGVGLPMGQGGVHAAKYIVMEVHYNNPQLHTEIRDASGMRLVYTDRLRAEDASLITLGQMPLRIPPRGEAEYVNECGGECTARLASEVTVGWSFLHMHEIGSEIWTQHIRDGVELAPLGENRHWNFNSQAGQHLNATIKPGDQLITHCKFRNPHDRTVTWGEGTQDEMCFNWLLVWPASSVVFCSQGTRRDTEEREGRQMCVTAEHGGRSGDAMRALFAVDAYLGPGGEMEAEVGDLYIAMATAEGKYAPFRDQFCAAEAAARGGGDGGAPDLAPVVLPILAVVAVAAGGVLYAHRKRAARVEMYEHDDI